MDFITLMRVLALGFLAALTSVTSARTQRIVCPDKLPDAALHLGGTPAGWTSFIAAPLYLHAAGPTYGPPEMRGQLIGQSILETKTKSVERFDLSGPYKDGKWMECDYGMLNEVALSMRLDDDTKACTVTGNKGEKAGQYLYTILCE